MARKRNSQKREEEDFYIDFGGNEEAEDNFYIDFGSDTESGYRPSRQRNPEPIKGSVYAKEKKPKKQKRIQDRPKQQKQPRKSKPVRQKTERQAKKTRLRNIILGIAIVSLLGGLLLSNLAGKTNSNTGMDNISQRVADQKDTNIKSTNEDPQADIIDLLAVVPFSRSELINALIALGHSQSTASEAVNASGYDDKEVAKQRIDLYLEATGFSSKGLAGRLIADGFDQTKAMEALAEKNKEIDYVEQAKRRGYSYLENYVLNQQQMHDALAEDGFTEEDITKVLAELPLDK